MVISDFAGFERVNEKRFWLMHPLRRPEFKIIVFARHYYDAKQIASVNFMNEISYYGDIVGDPVEIIAFSGDSALCHV